MASSPSGAWTVQLGFGNTISLDVGIAPNEIMHPSKIGIYNVFTHVNYNYSENPSLMIFNKLQYVISMSLKFFPRDCFGLPSPMLPSLPWVCPPPPSCSPCCTRSTEKKWTFLEGFINHFIVFHKWLITIWNNSCLCRNEKELKSCKSP